MRVGRRSTLGRIMTRLWPAMCLGWLLPAALAGGALGLVSPAWAAKESLVVPVTDPAPVNLQAELYTPSGSGPYPTVVVMHGCGGVGPNVPAWAMWLRSEGYAALVLDS